MTTIDGYRREFIAAEETFKNEMSNYSKIGLQVPSFNEDLLTKIDSQCKTITNNIENCLETVPPFNLSIDGQPNQEHCSDNFKDEYKGEEYVNEIKASLSRLYKRV